MHCYQFHFSAMGGPCSLQLYAETEALAQAAASAAQAEVTRLEQKYSRYRDDSVIGRINRAAGREAVAIDSETAAMLDYADTLYQQSEGLFDITAGVLRRVWDFKVGQLPEADAVARCVEKIAWPKVERSEAEVYMPARGMELDFGGFGKEYAADRAAAVCKAQGVDAGVVELSGDLHVLGPHPDGSPWRVGLQNARALDQAAAVIEVSSGGVASSGDYERFFEFEGKRYCHLLNPRSGWPVDSALAGVSAVAPQCLLAGSACTVAMLKATAAEDWLKNLGLPYLLQMRDGDNALVLRSGAGLQLAA